MPGPWDNQRKTRRPGGFVATVAVVAIAAFGLALASPELTSTARLIALAPQVPPTATLEPSPSSLSPQLATRSQGGQAGPGRFPCRVTAITDGDTLRCADGTRIRLHAVAARERDETCSSGHPCPAASGAAATAVLEGLASGRTLSCRRIGRSYDRVTAICWTPEAIEVNCAMVRSGTALVWDRFDRQTPICR